MARKKENKRSDGYYEHKCIVDRKYDGTPIYKSFYSKKSKADARSKAEKYKQDLSREKNKYEDITFAEWAEIFLQHQKSKVKITTYLNNNESVFKNHLLPHFGSMRLKNIIKADIEDYIELKSKDLKPSTLNLHLSTLSKLFAEAIDNGIVEYSPCRNVKRSSASSSKRVYTPEQAELVLKYCRLDSFGLPVHMILSYGMSNSEFLGITYDDIDFENLTLSINKGITKKNKYTDGDILAGTKNKFRNRTIAISQESADYIKECVQFGHLADPNKKGIPNCGTFRDRYYAFMKRMHNYYMEQGIDVPALNVHELRHTRASIWVNEGKNLFAIAEMLGWSDLSMLRKVYGHADIQQLRKDLEI